MARDRSRASYEWVTLRSTNVNYVSAVTGISKQELKNMLFNAAKKGRYELRIPLDTAIFTREDK